MRAIFYRDIVSIKNQKKNFFLSLIFLFSFPFVIRLNNLRFLNPNYLFLVVSAMVPITIGLQFSNYLLLEDKKNDIFPLLFRNGVTIYGYYLFKAIIPTCIAVIFNLVSFTFYNFFFNNLLEQFNSKQLFLLFFVGVSLTILVLLVSEVLIFIIKNEAYYSSSCILVSLLIIGATFYLVNPFVNTLVFFGLIILFSLVTYLVLDILLKRKYNYFRGNIDD